MDKDNCYIAFAVLYFGFYVGIIVKSKLNKNGNN